MKFFVSFFSLILLTLNLSSVSGQNRTDILGVWLTEEKEAKIEIYQNYESKTFEGKIVWLKTPNGKDGKPVTGKNGEAVLNMVNLKGFNFEDNEWVDGIAYDPKSGSTYYCTLTLIETNKLKVRGSVDPMGWIGRTNYWTRAE